MGVSGLVFLAFLQVKSSPPSGFQVCPTSQPARWSACLGCIGVGGKILFSSIRLSLDNRRIACRREAAAL